MLPSQDTLISKISEKCQVAPKLRFKDFAHPLSDKLVGRAFRLIYENDNGELEDILSVRFLDEYRLEWWGEAGPLNGHEQSEAYMLFDIAENIYFLTWYEQAAPAVAGEEWKDAGFLMAIVMDLNEMAATDAYTNPMPGSQSGTQFIMAQARIEEIEQ